MSTSAIAGRVLALPLAVATVGGVGILGALTAAKPADSAAPLSPVAREVLRNDMKRHVDSTSKLMQSTLRLRYGEARAAAEEIAYQPVWGTSPRADPSTLNAELPPRFYELQDQMRESARIVSAAAQKKDPQALAQAFGTLTRSCVACHAVFMPPQK